MKIVLWELRSANDQSVRCAHQQDPPSTHRVTVTVGEIERFSELYRTEADAHDEAAHLLSHFMLKGWTDVTYRDSRIALPGPSDLLVHFAVTKSRSRTPVSPRDATSPIPHPSATQIFRELSRRS